MNYTAMLNKQLADDTRKAQKKKAKKASIDNQIDAIAALLNDVSKGKRVKSDERIVVFGQQYQLKTKD